MNKMPDTTAFAPENADVADDTLTLNVTDQQGRLHHLQALEGWRVMEVIRDWGLDIKAECGGACACATCHVYVGRDWLDKMPEKRVEEEEMLDGAFEVRDESRLSCQILMTPELDGLDVTLAPGSEK